MVIKVLNNPSIKDAKWNIEKVKDVIPITVLSNVGVKFSLESDHKVLPIRKLKTTEFAIHAKIDQVIDENMVFMSLSDFFLEVQKTLDEPTDTVVDIFLNAMNTKFSEADIYIIVTHNFCSLLKKTFERLCDMQRAEASSYFYRIINLHKTKITRNLKGKIGKWLCYAMENSLYLDDLECKKQYMNFLNGKK